MCTNTGEAKASYSRLKNGETAFASFAPTPLRPEGEAIIARTADGGYRYMGNIPTWDSIKTDTDSDEYKQAQKDFNVKARFYPDGHIEVVKGGLYDRNKSYKNADAFREDVSKRIDSRSEFDKRDRDSISKGRISQILAEYYRGIINKNSSSMAIKKMNEGIRNDMQTIKTRLEVADKAKRKINQVIESGTSRK